MDSAVNIEPEQDKPHDLSMKPNNNVVHQEHVISQNNSNVVVESRATLAHRVRVPPPLDLNAKTLELDHVQDRVGLGGGSHDPSVRVPKSPNELPRESLPLRKR